MFVSFIDWSGQRLMQCGIQQGCQPIFLLPIPTMHQVLLYSIFQMSLQHYSEGVADIPFMSEILGKLFGDSNQKVHILDKINPNHLLEILFGVIQMI